MANGPTTSSANDARLTLSTFGAARLFTTDSTGRETTLLESGKPLALIVYLACAPKRHAPRDSVIDLLWADLEPDAARHALRQTLWHIKRRVADGLLAPAGESIALSDRISVDRDQLLAAASADDIERVVQLYRGAFFPAFAAPGGAEFEKWADTERRYLRSIYQRSADALVRKHLSSGRFREAQDIARQLRGSDDEHEAAWRLLLEALLAGRDHAAARMEADALEQMLSRDERHPEQATRSLIRLARQPAADTPAAGQVAPSLVAELIGREREFSAILSAWDRVRLGHFHHIHITAPAGLGKTRLLADVGARLRAMRARVLHVRAIQPSREIPYALASDVVAELSAMPGAAGVSPDTAATLVAMTPLVSTVFSAKPDRASGDEALRRRAIALRDLLSAVSDQHPLAILLDDLHWADVQSHRILASVVGTLGQHRALVVTASRAPESDLVSSSSTNLALASLTEPEVLALVSSLGTMPPNAWSMWFVQLLSETTHGSPLLILETLHLLIERGMLALRGTDWHAIDESALRDALRSKGALAVRVAALSERDRTCLCLLAVSGVPMHLEVVSSLLPRAGAELVDTLRSLEARGFITRQGDGWQIVHDEIARTVVDMSPSDALAEAEGMLGERLWHDAGEDLARVRRAAWHLTRGRREAILTLAFVRFARLLREGGDRRSNQQIAAELLGDDAHAPRARELARALPVHMRVGLYTRQRRVLIAAAGVGGILLTAKLAAPEPAGSAPDVQLIVVEPSNPTADVVVTPLRAAEWPAGTTLEVRRGRRVELRLSNEIAGRTMVPEPGGHSWAQSRAPGDSGVLDVFITGRRGQDRRMTDSPGDEEPYSWSPDGKYVALWSGKWNRDARYDIATIDIGTGDQKQLTAGDETDTAPVWSPDGTRVGFVRRDEGSDVPGACWVSFDGLREKCVAPFELGIVEALGWLDANNMIVRHAMGETGTLVSVELTSGKIDTVKKGVMTAVASADGKWIACYCRTGTGDGLWIAFPSEAPERERPLVAGGVRLGRDAHVMWRPMRPSYLDTLRLIAAPNDAQVGVPHRLLLEGRTNHGEPSLVRAVVWSVSDTTLATIDPDNGDLLPRRPGQVTVVASAGGWRTALAEFSIQPRRESGTLFGEDWDEPPDKKWFLFGEPRSSIVAEPWGGALLVNGDENFASGVHSRAAIPTGDGLSLDALISVPVTNEKWQNISIGFLAGLDTLLATPLLRLNGEHEKWLIRPGVECMLDYPGDGEKAGSTNWIRAHSGGKEHKVPLRSPMRTDRPSRIRIQLFLDGRCGIAVEGVPLFVSDEPVVRRDSVRVVAKGMSVHTRVLLGPLTVRSGVPGDIDWSRLAPAPRQSP